MVFSFLSFRGAAASFAVILSASLLKEAESASQGHRPDDVPPQARRTHTSSRSSARTPLCEQVNLLQNGTLELVDGLAGMKIRGAVTLWDDGLLAKSADGQWSGLYWELLSELAKRGGFEFELIEHPFGEGHGWTDWLFETMEIYDINVEYWLPTALRTSKGAFPVFGIFETSTQFAVHAKPNEKKLEWFSFLYPLSDEVWYTLLASSIATSLAYTMAEWGRNEDDLMSAPAESIFNTIFLSLFTVTGAGTFTPKSWSGKIITWSWAWCILLFVSAYTANLAAFLIIKPKSGVSFDSLEAAMSAGTTICVWKGTPQEEYLSAYIASSSPQYKGTQVTAKHPMQALYDDDCDAALGAAIEIRTARDSYDMNPCCSLEVVGGSLTFTEGSWMVKNDYVESCTALVRDVLFALSVRLKDEGVFDSLVNAYFDAKASGHCTSTSTTEKRCPGGQLAEDQPLPQTSDRRLEANAAGSRQLKAKGKAAAAAAAAASGDEPQERMGLDAMAGMFLVHGLLLIFGCCSHTFRLVKDKVTKCRKGPEVEEEDGDSSFKLDPESSMKLDKLASGHDEVLDSLRSQRRRIDEMHQQQVDLAEALKALHSLLPPKAGQHGEAAADDKAKDIGATNGHTAGMEPVQTEPQAAFL
eukprot:TRINITY_DN18560_c0_g1_i1.p1 TRINITY_DN18560_c0_g1~~TRINITY_DN18560_c0_g1_i1.p1  ORF type:complete len:641 (+),score=129.69 TRINITY_DN18560_c0_g1_i1:147-2069(+)